MTASPVPVPVLAPLTGSLPVPAPSPARPRRGLALVSLVLAAALALPAPASAAPRVVADIAPVHSLVAKVMGTVGEPELLLPAAVSPHKAALRPSQARALDEAEVVFWIGARFTPQLGRAIEALAAEALVVPLIGLPRTKHLAIRRKALFADENAPDEPARRRSIWMLPRAPDGSPPLDGPIDPHVWLDPDNARVWLPAIAQWLSFADPENADRYVANAEAAAAGLGELTLRLEKTLAPHAGAPFFVMHDAYRYFEDRFAVEAVGAIAVSDAARPGPRRIAALQALAEERGISCIFTEPQLDPRLGHTVAEATGARIATLDPLGADLSPGAALYDAVLVAMAENLATCLSAQPG